VTEIIGWLYPFDWPGHSEQRVASPEAPASWPVGDGILPTGAAFRDDDYELG